MNVPEDYPGTFLDFKQELTEKLISQGMDPSTFRITTTAAKIDTTNLNGWYVYDHYYDQAQYNSLNLSADQQLKQPFRAADNSYISGSVTTIQASGARTTNISGCRAFKQHVDSFADANGKANMVFAGYGTSPLLDYMFYPATSDSRRTISFDMDASAVGPHTLAGAGFLLNCGIVNGNLTGYVLYFTGLTSQTPTAVIRAINFPVNSNEPSIQSGTQLGSTTINLGPQKKARLTIDLRKDRVSVQSQPYSGGTLGTLVTNFNSIPLTPNGLNGFGPVVGYTSHGCSELTIYRFMDLEMRYEASAFDALKQVQYYEGAEYKYFINLVGASNNPQVPDEKDPTYADGINRMNENEIFYISNGNDGKIVTDSTDSHLGLGAGNGFYATGDDYVEAMAQFIATNYFEENHFQQAQVKSEIPLANFFIEDVNTGDQVMTIHKQHLVNTGDTVTVNIFDKSKTGTAGTRISQWQLKIYDPNNTEVYASGWKTNLNQIEDFVYDKTKDDGRWIFDFKPAFL